MHYLMNEYDSFVWYDPCFGTIWAIFLEDPYDSVPNLNISLL